MVILADAPTRNLDAANEEVVEETNRKQKNSH